MFGFNGEQEGDLNPGDDNDDNISDGLDSSEKDPHIAFIDGDALDNNDYD
jgi:hypothetical protein